MAVGAMAQGASESGYSKLRLLLLVRGIAGRTESYSSAPCYREHRVCGLEPQPQPAKPWSTHLVRTAGGRKWGSARSGLGDESNLRGTLPTIPSAWSRVVLGMAGTGYRCRTRVGRPQPRRAPHRLKKTRLASTALKGELHGWTASCRDSEKVHTQYFAGKGTRRLEFDKLKDENKKNRRHVVLNFDLRLEDMNILNHNLYNKHIIVCGKDGELAVMADGILNWSDG